MYDMTIDGHMNEEKYYTIGNADWPIAHPLVQIVKDHVVALEKIERFGHSNGHGHGYTCANIAEEVLRKHIWKEKENVY